MDRTDAFQRDNRRIDLLNRNLYRANYSELDPDVETGGRDREEAQFLWKPLNLDDEHFEILTVHRDGSTVQDLRLRRAGEKWAFATRVSDKKTKDVLIECRDQLQTYLPPVEDSLAGGYQQNNVVVFPLA